KPTPRGNIEFTGYCSRGRGCDSVCDSPKANSPFNSPYNPKEIVRRGDKFKVTWLRQNHPGGFVRLAFAPMENSDDASAFVPVKYSCYESHCQEASQVDMLGTFNGPGSSQCWTEVTIPTHLPDGPITLQWTWFGGGVFYADKNASFANYVSCSDLELKGGAPQTTSLPSPTFEGATPPIQIPTSVAIGLVTELENVRMVPRRRILVGMAHPKMVSQLACSTSL
ncbi:hypothetical protein L0F63_003195, partial [Massospora cicadina]